MTRVFRQYEWCDLALAASVLVRIKQPVRTCKVSCPDPQGIEHTVEVSAQSVFEAVAHTSGFPLAVVPE